MAVKDFYKKEILLNTAILKFMNIFLKILKIIIHYFTRDRVCNNPTG